MRQLKIANDRLTSRTDNVTRYLNEVSTKSMISPEEEYQIGIRAQQGDEKAINQLASANLRFVVSVAKQYSANGALFEDLICQGNIGLCDAARTFDPSRGFKFISYAVWHIRKEILSYLNSDHRTVRIPLNVLNDLTKIKRAEETILQEQGRYGTFEELQKETSKMGKDFTEDHIKRITTADSRSIPLDSDDQDDRHSPIDWLSSGLTTTHLTDASDLTEATRIVLSRLTDIQRDVVTRRIGISGKESEAFSTIAKRYERTPEWARSVYTKAIRTMQVRLRSSKISMEKILG